MKFFFGCSILFLFIILSGETSIAQTTHRNLLPEFSNQQLKEALIPQEKFKPFPQSAEGWKMLLPDL